MGWAQFAIFQSGMANTAATHDSQNSVQANLFSLLGSFQAETKVGIDPKNTTLTLTIMASTGLLDTIQRIIPTTALDKQNLSSLVHPGPPYFSAKATVVQPPIITPMIWPLTE